MSVIDRVLQGDTVEPDRMTLREAATVLLVATVTCDGTIAPREGERLRSMLSSMRMFRGVDPEHVQRLFAHAATLIQRLGAESVITACATAIPDELRATLFALVVELVFIDGRVTEREKQFVDRLQAALHLEDDMAMKIVEVMLIKSRA